MADPLDLASIDRLTQALERRIEPVVCDNERLRALIARAYSMALAEAESEGSDESQSLTSGAEPLVVAVKGRCIAALKK